MASKVSGSSDCLRDDAADEDMYNYKALRWLWNEPEQLQRRYLRFNLMALIQAVEDVAGPGASCVEVTKLPEGNFNKAFLVTMQDQRQLVARLPNPNAGRPHYTTASEVATMDYVPALSYQTLNQSAIADAMYRFEAACKSPPRK